MYVCVRACVCVCVCVNMCLLTQVQDEFSKIIISIELKIKKIKNFKLISFEAVMLCL